MGDNYSIWEKLRKRTYHSSQFIFEEVFLHLCKVCGQSGLFNYVCFLGHGAKTREPRKYVLNGLAPKRKRVSGENVVPQLMAGKIVSPQEREVSKPITIRGHPGNIETGFDTSISLVLQKMHAFCR